MHDGPADEFTGTVEETEHRIEEEHLEENIFPFGEPFFSIRESVGDEGKRGDHDEDHDDTLAEADGDEADDNRDGGAEKGDSKHPEESAKTASSNAGDGKKGGAARKASINVFPGQIVKDSSFFTDGDGGLDFVEHAGDAGAEDVTEIDSGSADNITEINKDDGDDNAGESAFDTVIINTEAGKLGINDNKKEDDEGEVTEFADFVPDLVDGGFMVIENRLDDEDVADGGVGAIDNAADDLGGGTDNPREGASSGLTDVFVSIIGGRIIRAVFTRRIVGVENKLVVAIRKIDEIAVGVSVRIKNKFAIAVGRVGRSGIFGILSGFRRSFVPW